MKLSTVSAFVLGAALLAAPCLYAQTFNGQLTGQGSCSLDSGMVNCSDVTFEVAIPEGLNTYGSTGVGAFNLDQTVANTGILQFVNFTGGGFVTNPGLGTGEITSLTKPRVGNGTITVKFGGSNYTGTLVMNYQLEPCTGNCSHQGIIITSSSIQFVGVNNTVAPADGQPLPYSSSCYSISIQLIWNNDVWPLNGWWLGDVVLDNCAGGVRYYSQWFPIAVSPTCENGVPYGSGCWM